jgi:hypothetical protein
VVVTSGATSLSLLSRVAFLGRKRWKVVSGHNIIGSAVDGAGLDNIRRNERTSAPAYETRYQKQTQAETVGTDMQVERTSRKNISG